jgi:class 3 adenylate cyclase
LVSLAAGGKAGVERRLAAILAADVVGTAASWSKMRRRPSSACGRKEFFEPEIERHQGRILKLAGMAC